jgi:phospholipid/cholesterol/gamma-HCH transport system substrate-binding protein
MQKQAPSIGRILVAVGFTLSCFGLILFLWIAFGGPIPLKPESYRVTAYFPEATQLAVESDVRIGGVSVGKVKEIKLASAEYRVDGKDTTEATIEIEPEFAPISDDARAILRQKTLLGETYVEFTSGTEPGSEEVPVSLGAAGGASDAAADAAESVEEGDSLGVGRTEQATQIDEIFNALDEETRVSFRRWQANAAVAITDRGLDLNDSLGNLGPFLTDASDVVGILERQKAALKGLVRDTGTVFEALTARDQELAGLITGSHNTFEALASEDEALAETFQILPTFERESRLTFERLDEFQADTTPLVEDLIPVARELSPTLESVRELSPNLRSLFVDLDDLNKSSRKGLPALRDFLGGLRPVLDRLDPFLANLNPAIDYLRFYRDELVAFISGPPGGIAGNLPNLPGQPAPRHVLRQVGYISAESLSVHPERLPTNRGNGYLLPRGLRSPASASAGIFENWDCENTGEPGNGEVTASPPVGPGFAPCIIAGDQPTEFGGEHAPQVFMDP